MRRLPALVAALLLPAAQPLLLGTALSTASLLVSQAAAQAQSQEAVGKVAQAITVRLETSGAGGSGVLVKRDGNRYTVLTAWHVVSGQRPGEELDIYTSDGQRRLMEQGSIKRLGEVDLAVLTFSSPTAYEVARVGDIKSVAMGSAILVAGFPLASSSVPTRLLRLIKGDVIANATVAIPDGYQLLYDNQTLPGVSGGAVLNAKGELVGIHGKAEKADQVSESSGKAVATGTNQGVPISYYKQYAAGEVVVASTTKATTADDYLAQARALIDKKGSEQEVIRLASQAIILGKSADAYHLRAYARSEIADFEGAVNDYSSAIRINSRLEGSYQNRGMAYMAMRQPELALSDFQNAAKLDNASADHRVNVGNALAVLGRTDEAFMAFKEASLLDPLVSQAWVGMGLTMLEKGNKKEACRNFVAAQSLKSQHGAKLRYEYCR